MRSCIWPVRHSAATSISARGARALAERAARTHAAGACSAPPPGRWRVAYSALVLTIVRPPRSISAAFAEVVPRSRQSRPIMTAGYARVVSARAGDADRPTTDSRPTTRDRRRSEEHTSELQSRGQLVCRLLLEKKKFIQRADGATVNDVDAEVV